jgi:putative flippase GtrA
LKLLSSISLRDLISQALRFGIVGVINTLLDIILFYLLVQFLGLSQVQVLAKAFSFFAGTLSSYWLNSQWTFQHAPNSRTLVKFICVSLLLLVVNVAVFQLIFESTRNNLFGVLAATAATFALGFTVNKLWTFKT